MPFRWNESVESFGVDIEDALAEDRTRIALNLMSLVVQKTPVDTGRARSAWNLTYDAPVDFEGAEFGQGGSGAGQAANAAIARNSAALATRASRPFETVYISNSLPYIQRLEDGHSRQAPAGTIVAQSIVEIRVRYEL